MSYPDIDIGNEEGIPLNIAAKMKKIIVELIIVSDEELEKINKDSEEFYSKNGCFLKIKTLFGEMLPKGNNHFFNQKPNRFAFDDNFNDDYKNINGCINFIMEEHNLLKPNFHYNIIYSTQCNDIEKCYKEDK